MVSYSSLCIYWRWPQSLRKVQLVTVLSAGFLIHLSLGSLYTYGNLVPYIVSYVRERSSPQSLRYTDATFILAAQIAGQGTSMALGGWLEKRFGPRLVSLFGGWFMSLGVLLSYLTIKVSFWLLLVTYGIMFGLGVGIAYVGPIACAMRWLPKWKGVAAGVIVSGFGLSALFFDIVQTLFINPHDKEPNSFPYEDYPTEEYFSQPEVIDRVPHVFLLLGAIFIVMQIIGSIFLVNPPLQDEVVVEYQPISREPAETTNDNYDTTTTATNSANKEEGGRILFKDKVVSSTDGSDEEKAKEKEEEEEGKCQSLKSDILLLFSNPKFYLLWFMFFCSAIVGTFISSLFKSFGFEAVTPDDYFLSVTASASALFNFGGRIFWGFFADITDYNFAFVSKASFIIVLLATFYGASFGGKGLFVVWICGLFFCIGGIYTLAPHASIYLFGSKSISLNYGFVYTAAASGSVAGAFISHFLVRVINWYGIFFLLSGIQMIELFLAFFL